MRILFEIDRKDYENCTKTFSRNSSRSIIIHNHQIAMIHSLKYDYYKFPGGGIEPNESPIDALIRETREEAGLQIQKDSIQEYGCVHRIQKSSFDEKECFIQDNFYYLCNVEEGTVLQNLDKYESMNITHWNMWNRTLPLKKTDPSEIHPMIRSCLSVKHVCLKN